jgi:hypothetical protein
MTFKEMKQRVEAYKFGPYGRMKFERSPVKGAYEIVFEFKTRDMKTGKPIMIPFAYSITSLNVTDAVLGLLIEGCWNIMMAHEMREHMTRYETKVYTAH